MNLKFFLKINSFGLVTNRRFGEVSDNKFRNFLNFFFGGKEFYTGLIRSIWYRFSVTRFHDKNSFLLVILGVVITLYRFNSDQWIWNFNLNWEDNNKEFDSPRPLQKKEKFKFKIFGSNCFDYPLKKKLTRFSDKIGDF